MKFKFNWKNKEVDFEADVEGLAKTGMEHRQAKPDRKSRYQIKQEEKRKQQELEHKQTMQYIFIFLGLIALCAVLGVVASVLNI